MTRARSVASSHVDPSRDTSHDPSGVWSPVLICPVENLVAGTVSSVGASGTNRSPSVEIHPAVPSSRPTTIIRTSPSSRYHTPLPRSGAPASSVRTSPPVHVRPSVDRQPRTRVSGATVNRKNAPSASTSDEEPPSVAPSGSRGASIGSQRSPSRRAKTSYPGLPRAQASTNSRPTPSSEPTSRPDPSANRRPPVGLRDGDRAEVDVTAIAHRVMLLRPGTRRRRRDAGAPPGPGSRAAGPGPRA